MKLLQTYSGKDDWAFWIKEGDPVWYLLSSFEEKDLAKSAGFSWHGKKGDDGKWTGKKVWFTGERDKAAKMADYADQLSEWGKDLMKRKVELITSLSGSRQSVSYAEIPRPEGLEYYPFQKAGVETTLNMFGFIQDPYYIKGIGKEGQYADRSIQQNAGVSREDVTMSFNGEDSRSEGNSIKEDKGDVEDRRMEDEGFNKNKNSISEAGGEEAVFRSHEDSEETRNERLQRFASDRSSKEMDEVLSSNGICSGISDKNEGSWNNPQATIELQSGFCQFGEKDSGGVGRPSSQKDKAYTTGQKENRGFTIPWVESDKNKTQLKGVLIADQPGLGKTVEAIGFINCVPSIKRILVICPATIKTNWVREMRRWFTRDMGRIQIAGPNSDLDAEIIITNYESVNKLNGKLVMIDFDLMIIDECHFCKNTKTLRYMSIMGGIKKVKDKADKRYDRLNFKRALLLTGTPVCNRPAELWPLLNICDPEHWNSKTFFYYHKRYCNAQPGRYGYDFKGASDESKLNELQIKLRENFLIRRLKSDVLTELPPKIRQIIELEYDENDGDIRRCLKAEKEIEDRESGSDAVIEKMAKVELAKVSGNDDEYRSAVSELASVGNVEFTETSKVRHDTAIAKLPYAIEFIKEQLESVPKIVIAAYHHDVIEGFAKAFPLESVSIYGEMNLDARQRSIDRFQTDENCRVAILSMVLGVGITLTAASHIYFVEEDWVPATVTQTEDRLHRISQKNCVNVYHLVLANSIDVKMIKMVMEKQKVIEATLDKILESEPVIPRKERAVTASLSRQKIAEEAETITEAEVEEIHDKLKTLAEMDRDHARMQNGVGFSRIDGYMGHQLAQTMFLSKKQAVIGRRLCKKYAGQLGRLETVETY